MLLAARMFIALFVTFFPASLLAGTRYVCNTPGCCGSFSPCYGTIAQAVDAAVTGDTLLIAGGTYEENIGFAKNGLFTILGSHSPDFSSRNRDQYTTYINHIYFNDSGYNYDVVVDGFDVKSAQENLSAVYFTSANGALTVRNCNIHDDHYLAVQAAFFNNGFALLDNTITGSNIFYNAVSVFNANGPITISGNKISGQTCSNCTALVLTGLKTGDVVADNEVFGNFTGMSVSPAPAQAPRISGNRVHGNQREGMVVGQGASLIANNIAYENGWAGIFVYVSGTITNPTIVNNLLAYNGDGLEVRGPTGKPIVKNNVFLQNDHVGFYINGGGFGSTNIAPAAVKYNVFSGTTGPRIQHNGIPDTYNDEIKMNELQDWEGNMIISDPKFVDPAGSPPDFTLQPSSFLVDEGDPSDDVGSEPEDNGDRINIGPEGGQASAHTSQPVSVSNVAVTVDGNDLIVGFDTGTAVSEVWVSAEYFDGANYHPVSPASLSGSGFVKSYRSAGDPPLAGRIAAGSSRQLRYLMAGKDMLGLVTGEARIRLTVSHGAQSASAESPEFAVDYSNPVTRITLPAPDYPAVDFPIPFSADAYDSEGISEVRFLVKASTEETWTTISSDTSPPYEADWTGRALDRGKDYDYRVIAFNMGGHTGMDTLSGYHYCRYELSPTSLLVSLAAQTVPIDVITSHQGCGWCTMENDWWLSMEPGTGTSQVDLNIQQSFNGPRSGHLVITGGAEVVVTQSNPTPTRTPTPTITPSVTPRAPVSASPTGIPATSTPSATPTPHDVTPAPSETPSLLPDIAAVRVSASKRSGRLKLNYVCKNVGSGSSRDVITSIYLKGRKGPRGDARRNLRTKKLGIIGPGESSTAMSFSYPLSKANGYREVRVNCSSSSPESRANNNEFAVRL